MAEEDAFMSIPELSHPSVEIPNDECQELIREDSEQMTNFSHDETQVVIEAQHQLVEQRSTSLDHTGTDEPFAQREHETLAECCTQQPPELKVVSSAVDPTTPESPCNEPSPTDTEVDANIPLAILETEETLAADAQRISCEGDVPTATPLADAPSSVASSSASPLSEAPSSEGRGSMECTPVDVTSSSPAPSTCKEQISVDVEHSADALSLPHEEVDNVSTQLAMANDTIRNLRLSQEAMVSSVDALKVLVENERAVTRVTKRRLDIANKRVDETPDHSSIDEMNTLRARLEETDKQLHTAKRNEESLNAQLRSFHSRLEAKDVEYQRVLDSNEALLNEKRATRLQIADLRAQREQRDAAYQSIVEQLQDKNTEADRAVTEVDALRRKLEVSQSVTAERDELVEKVSQLTRDLQARDTKSAETETSLRAMVMDKEECLTKSATELREAAAKIAGLEHEVSELDTLRARIAKLESTNLELRAASSSPPVSLDMDSSSDSTDNKSTKAALKKKKMELKIARAVIAEKDKVVSELRENVTNAEDRAREVEVSSKVTESRLGQMETAINKTKEEMSVARADAQAAIDAKRDVEVKLTAVEKSLRDAKEHLTQVERTAHEHGMKRSEYADLSERLEARIRSVEKEKQEALGETEKLRASLSTAQQEISRLENELRKNAPEEMGTSSPCSDGSVSATLSVPRSDFSHLESLADLEAASNGAAVETGETSSAGQSETGGNSDASAMSPKISALPSSAAPDRNDEVSQTESTVTALSNSLQKMETAMSAKVEECNILESRISIEMKPALEAANVTLQERMNEVDQLRGELNNLKITVEKERVDVAAEKGETSKQMKHTLTMLHSTQDKLKHAEEHMARLNSSISELETEKSKNLMSIKELRCECEHRQQALVNLRDRLVVFENLAGTRGQHAENANEENKRLKKLLASAEDGKCVSESRAFRKDELLFQLENKYRGLEKNHGIIVSNLREKSKLVEKHESELLDLRKALEESAGAMKEQSQLACTRDELQTTTIKELRQIIQSREDELKDTTEELTAIERRAKSLSDALASSSARLRTAEENLHNERRSVADAETTIARKEEALREVKKVKLLLESKIVSAKTAIDHKEDQISSQLQAIMEKDDQIDSLSKDKAHMTNSISDLKSQLAVEKSRRQSQEILVRKLEGDVRKTRTDINSLTTICTDKESEANGLRSKVAVLQSEVSSLQSDLSQRVDQVNHLKEKEMSTREMEALSAVADKQKKLMEKHAIALDELKEKKEEISSLSDRYSNAKKHCTELDKRVAILESDLLTRAEEINSLNKDLGELDSEKKSLYTTLANTQKSKAAAEALLVKTQKKLLALEQSTQKEIALLKARVASQEVALSEKDNSSSSTARKLTQVSSENTQLKDQVVESKTRADHLLSKLTATEFELASEKEAIATLDLKFRVAHDKLEERESHVQRLESELLANRKDLADTQLKLTNVSAQKNREGNAELMAIRGKLDAKEKSISKLQDWCSFVNTKLRSAETALLERETELELSSEAFVRLQEQVDTLNGKMREKESEMRMLETTKIAEGCELRSRIMSLESEIDESNTMDVKTKELIINTSNPKTRSTIVDVFKELTQCKSSLRNRDQEVSELRARRNALEKVIKKYEQDLGKAQTKVDQLSDELEKAQSEAECNKLFGEGENDADDGMSVASVHNEAVFLLSELRRSKSEMISLRESAKKWQERVEELEPLAEQTASARRGVDILSSRLELEEKNSKLKMELLETKLKEARRERDAMSAERSTVKSEFSAIEETLHDVYGEDSTFKNMGELFSLSTVTFMLSGREAPKSNVLVYVLGGDLTLGQWNPTHAIPMRVVGKNDRGVVRECKVVMPSTISTTYKYAAEGSHGEMHWESGSNRSLKVAGKETFTMRDAWRS